MSASTTFSSDVLFTIHRLASDKVEQVLRYTTATSSVGGFSFLSAFILQAAIGIWRYYFLVDC